MATVYLYDVNVAGAAGAGAALVAAALAAAKKV